MLVEPAVDEGVFDDLAEAFKALASPARLEILARLSFPTPLRELEVAPRRHRPAENPERAMSTATLHEHLQKLRALRLVLEVAPAAGAPRYVVDRARLYALAETFRDLSVLREGMMPATDETLRVGRSVAAAPSAGPRMYLVHGAYEGRVFPLDPASMRDGGWTIGRLTTHAVSLDYDPYVSRTHARITLEGGSHVLTDVGGSQNGTHVNWARVAPGAAHALRSGEVVGVGRSLLVFAT